MLLAAIVADPLTFVLSPFEGERRIPSMLTIPRFRIVLWIARRAAAVPHCARFSSRVYLHCARSSGIIRHRGEHFFYSGFQSDPHRARNDGVANVQFRQARNLVNEHNIFVIDTMASIDLQM